MASTSGESQLTFRSVSFAYDQEPVLADLSFEVLGGEIVGYLGVNGAGKTTTFLLASGLLKPASGAISVVGCDPARSKKWSHEVGVLTAGAGLYPRLTVRRNLAFSPNFIPRKLI